MLTRRSFLQSSSLLALAPTVPLFVTRTARAAPENAHVLVVVQLDGGNDSLNTVVPHADPAYQKLRPKLKLEPKNLCSGWLAHAVAGPNPSNVAPIWTNRSGGERPGGTTPFTPNSSRRTVNRKAPSGPVVVRSLNWITPGLSPEIHTFAPGIGSPSASRTLPA